MGQPNRFVQHMRARASPFALQSASCFLVVIGSIDVGQHPSADKVCDLNADANSLIQVPSLVNSLAREHRETPLVLHANDVQVEYRDASGAMPEADAFTSDLTTYHRYAESVGPRHGNCN